MTVGISLSGASRESHHKQPLYCVAFSSDVYVGEYCCADKKDTENETRNIKIQPRQSQPQQPQQQPQPKRQKQNKDKKSRAKKKSKNEQEEDITEAHRDKEDHVGMSDSHSSDDNKRRSADDRSDFTRNSQETIACAAEMPHSHTIDCYYMATCGGTFLTLYQLHSHCDVSMDMIDQSNHSNRSTHNHSNNIHSEADDFTVRQIYQDVDEEEIFYSCIFAGRSRGNGEPTSCYSFLGENSAKSSANQNNLYGSNHEDESLGPQLCCVGGKRGLIKVIDTVQQALVVTLVGHSDELYDMKQCPFNEWLLLSASNDETIRLWNLKYPSQIAIFAGHHGHREAVLSIDWHPLGRYFASSGMDGTIRLWSMEESAVQNAIEESFKAPLWVEEEERGTATTTDATTTTTTTNTTKRTIFREKSRFKTVTQQLPFWVTSKLHTDYIDSISFVGDLILSKSTTNVISLWKPIFSDDDRHDLSSSSSSSNSKFLHLVDYSVPDCRQWYIRFGLDKDCHLMAVGNCMGDIRVWEIGGAKKPNIIHNPMCSAIIRMVAFSPDGKMMVAVCDDSSVWKYTVS